jgi:hypothetical protein
MSLFPRVQSPCPYKGKFADIMQGNQCRLCKREVVDITDMTDEARKSFLDACDTEVCISYRVGAKSALAAMAMSAVAVPTAAAAQDSEEPATTTEDGAAAEIEEYFYDPSMVIVVGGMKKPGEAEWLKDAPKREHQAGTSALPVEYDEAGTAQSKADKPRK